MKKEIFIVLKIYLLTWLIVVGWFVVRSFSPDLSLSETFVQLWDLLSYRQFVIAIHVFFGILYLLYLLIRYFVRIFKKNGFTKMLKQLFLRLALPVSVFVFTVNFIFNSNTTDNYKYSWNYDVENNTELASEYYKIDGKHRGMSVFGWRDNIDSSISELTKNNIEWVAVIPFLDQKDEQAEKMSAPQKMGHWSRRDSVFIKSIDMLHKRGINVMLKPHLWLTSGWRSNLKLKSRKHWNTWFETYKINMLHYAQMAEMTGVELICIGTELRTSIEAQPEQWKQLIKEIRAIYRGQLTYAANWDGEFDKIDFWDELDYIGIQAYFPLTNHKSPSLNEIMDGWDAHIATLDSLHRKYDKPILFTEIGYRSDLSSTIKPWEWNSLKNMLNNQKSDQSQQLAYEAMFNKLWHKNWFAGCYFWQWHTHTSKENAEQSLDFSPRYKPAENTMAKWYKTAVKTDSL